jgi:MinD superfamily P-loop ATPase
LDDWREKMPQIFNDHIEYQDWIEDTDRADRLMSRAIAVRQEKCNVCNVALEKSLTEVIVLAWHNPYRIQVPDDHCPSCKVSTLL